MQLIMALTRISVSIVAFGPVEEIYRTFFSHFKLFTAIYINH